MVLTRSSSCSTPTVRWRWYRHWRGLPVYSKEPLEEVAWSRRRSRDGTSRGSGRPAPDFPLRICLGFYVGRCVRACHLRSGILRFVRSFFVVASEISSGVVISHCFDQLERIGLMCGCEPGDLHIELAFILRERAFENACSDRARDLAAVPRGALHHHCDDVLRMVTWRETDKPRHVFLVTTFGGLRSAGFPSHHHIFQTRSAAGSSIVVNNLPKTFPDKLDILRRNFLPQSGSDSRRETHGLPLL